VKGEFKLMWDFDETVYILKDEEKKDK